MKGQLGVMDQQLTEMKAGGTDTHELAVQAKNQADRTKDVADSALRQANATNRLAVEARRSATSGEEFLALARTNAVLERRPYVWIVRLEPAVIEKDKQITWTAHFTNYGRSPAIRLLTRANMIGNPPLQEVTTKILAPPEVLHVGEDKMKGTILPPGKDDFFTAVSDGNLSEDEAKFDTGHDGGVLVHGSFEYFDMAGNVYRSDFCFLRLASSAAANCNVHNEIK